MKMSLGRSLLSLLIAALLALTIPVAAQSTLSASVNGKPSPKDPNETQAVSSDYMFKSDGVLIGQPPRTVVGGSTVSFAVIPGVDTEVASLLAGAVEGINVVKEKRQLPAFLLLGIDPPRLDVIRSTYCARARDLLANVKEDNARNSVLKRLADACPDPKAFPPDPEILPSFAIGPERYTLTFGCRDKSVPPKKVDGTGKDIIKFSDEEKADCKERSFALRLAKPVPLAAEKWAAANLFPETVRTALGESRVSYQRKSKRLHDLVEEHKALRDCLGKVETAAEIIKCTNKATPEDAFAELLRIRTSLTDANVELRDQLFSGIINAGSAAWVERWLWRSSGRPTLHPIEANDPDALGAKLEAEKVKLAAADAEIATLDKLIGDGVKIQNPDDLTKAVEKLSVIRKKKEEISATIAKLTRKIAAAQSARLHDEFLYDGTYFITEPVVPRQEHVEILMQHHDALSQYVVMGPPIDETTEKTQRVIILAENENPASQLKAAQTVTAITADASRFLDEVALSRAAAAPVLSIQTSPAFRSATPEQREEAIRQMAAAVIRQYDLFILGVEFADQELTDPIGPVHFVDDDTPTRVTMVVPHDIPSPAPAKVSYTIKKLEGTEFKDVATASYRLNRLYRVRFRTGLLFSTLETTKIETINNTPTPKIEKHGVDALFGVATFLGARRDPRTITRSKPAWSLLTALTARNPTQNVLIGVGYEPWGGVTFNAGGHVGRSERLSTAAGQPSTEDHWHVRPFFSITFDVDFLKQLFTIKPTV